ncbi:DNA polymerase III subunit alpha [Virgibacillus sp. MG-45]|uniref:DNA polymerase III subunit alpha n=1 Tax=Virgibacillus sp. MG-45 TaxID=3102791 RepID=UPI002ED7D05E
MSFTQLQVRSGYSLLDSTISIDKLVDKAASSGYTAIALTDMHVLYGVIPFYKACINKGLKPIVGMVVLIQEDEQKKTPCVLLAKNNHGYQQLIQLSSMLQLNDRETVELAQLQAYTDDLIGILPISQSHLVNILNNQSIQDAVVYVERLKNIFAATDFYLGIDEPETGRTNVKDIDIKLLQESCHVPLTVVQDVRYLDASDREAFDCLQAIKKGNRWSDQAKDTNRQQHYLRTEDEVVFLFAGTLTEALQRTEEIKNKCNVDIDLHTRTLPAYPVPNDEDAASYLRKLCHQGLRDKYQDRDDSIANRLEYELNVIESMGYSDYFLIVWDFIKFAKDHGILVGPGRGSSAGSIVAYLLDITEVDPIKHQLLFERFLNPERITMPDIDIDFSDQRRDEVIEYVRDKYGKEHVAQIITFGTFAARSLIRELFKMFDVDQQDASFILKEVPVQAKDSLKTIIQQSGELMNYITQSEKLKKLFSIAFRLEGLPKHLSTHAAGVVISKQPLVENVPLTLGSNETYLTQYAMNDLESIGLLKIDFLGLRNLSLLERIIHTIRQKTDHHVDLKKIPDDDKRTFNLLQSGKTNGIFQLESEGMKRVLKQLKPSHFEDIVAVNALYRPGPMENIEVYIARKHGKEPVHYPHPDLEPILKSTYGVLIYQEQIMQIANVIAGFSYGQADILRRAVSKKQQQLMDKQQSAFIQGCLQNGYDQSVAEKLFAWIIKFADYGFPKSHAVAYSKISYWLAYLKAHFSTYFYAELLSTVSGQHEKINLYMKELKELGIPFKGPSINKSFGKFTVEGDQIRMGLQSIKGVGNQAVKEIIQIRKGGAFAHLFDFCLRVPTKSINRSTLEALIMAGAFDETYRNRASLLASIDQAIEQGELFREFSDQPSFFQNELQLEASYTTIEDFSSMKRLADEKELLGVYISDHPLKQYRERFMQMGYATMSSAEEIVGKKNAQSIVMMQALKTIRTKRGDPMAFAVIGDETGEMEAVIFPELFRAVKPWIKEEQIVKVTGKIEWRNNRHQWLLAKIEPFNEDMLHREISGRLFIKITGQNHDEALTCIKQNVADNPGNALIIIFDEPSKKTYQLKDYYLQPTDKALENLKLFFGEENVIYKE